MSEQATELTQEQFATVLTLAGLSIPAEMLPQVLSGANGLRKAALALRSDRPATAEPAHVFRADGK